MFQKSNLKQEHLASQLCVNHHDLKLLVLCMLLYPLLAFEFLKLKH